MAVTPREQQIIDLDDAGLSVAQIAARLDMSEAYVRTIVRALCRNLGGNTGFNAMIERGSRALLDAIIRQRAA